MDRSESNRLLAVECAKIAALIEPATLAAPVDYCDGWPLGEVVHHLGEVHRFVHHVVRTGGPDDAGTYSLGGTAAPGATISGSAADLLLSVWRRPHGPIERTGDPTALAAFDSAALVP